MFARASLILVCMLGTAHADDGPQLSTAVEASVALGPVPAGLSFERLDLTAGTTLWHRLHLGVGGGIGTGGEASWLAEAFGELGLWLHASPRVDVLLGWRLGRSWLSIYDTTVHATMTATLFEVRLRLRPRLDVTVQPFALTAYYSGLWAVLAGPSIGLAVPW